MKKIIFIIIIFLALLFPIVPIYANEETLNEQKEEFGIQDFIKNAEKYTGEFFKDISIDEMLNDAIKGKVDNSTMFKKVISLFRK